MPGQAAVVKLQREVLELQGGIRKPCRLATTAALAASTFTAATQSRLADANGLIGTAGSIDGTVVAVGDRLLDKDHATTQYRGIWIVDSIGGASAKYALHRSSDFDSDTDAKGGMKIAISEGTANGNKTFFLSTDDPITLNTTGLTFTTEPSTTAAGVAIVDAGAFTAAAEVEAALAEIYQGVKTVTAIMPIPLTSFLDADGDPLAKFISAGSPTFGFNLADSEALCLRWNNDATPGTALCQVALPLDLDDTAAAQLEFLCSKSGATVGDATTLTITAFLVVAGDLHDADANAGGVTGALTGNAAAKTTALLSLAIAAGDIQPGVRTMTFTVTPTAGLLGTDDLLVHSVNLRYKRKIPLT